ncbi:sodium-dependent dopamine transporter-like [Ornithodoros turicata]|uniref:sodium-dependent dopamine transporter-like n=1 Tax=Ornithodoros turicata TaxID=34597 RepID=UPI00313A33F7
MSDGGDESEELVFVALPEKEYFVVDRTFLFICICIAVSYNTFVAFPLLLLKHGGVCFLVPYTILLAVIGVPMAALECILGQFLGKGALEMWTCVPVGKGVGMAMLLKNFVISTYRVMKDSYTFYYFLQAFQTELPWASCYTWWGANVLNCVLRNKTKSKHCYSEYVRLYIANVDKGLGGSRNSTTVDVCGKKIRIPYAIYLNGTSEACQDQRPISEMSFYINGVLKVSNGVDDFGGIRWELMVCYIFSWFFVFVCTSKGVATFGKMAPLMAIIPFITLIALAVKMMLLPNGRSAFFAAMAPGWSHIVSLSAWSDAAYYITSALEIGSGKLHAFSSYNNFESTGLYWAFIVLPLFVTVASIIGSIITLSGSGSLAESMGMCVSDLGVSSYVFPFVTFPELTRNMSSPSLWTGLFYFTFYMISIDEMMSNVAMVMTSAEDLFPNLRLHLNRTAFFICMAMFISGIPTATQAGPYIISLLEDNAVGGIMSQFIPMLEVAIFMWLYGISRWSFDIEFMLKRPPNLYFKTCWTVFCPILLAVFYFYRLSHFQSPRYMRYLFPAEYEALAWIIGSTALLQVPIGATACILDNIGYPGRAFQPEYHWEPNVPGQDYFEELEEQGVGEESSAAVVQDVLCNDTSVLEITVDPDAPLVFSPDI